MTWRSYWPMTNASELHFKRSFQGHLTWPYLAHWNMRPNMQILPYLAYLGVYTSINKIKTFFEKYQFERQAVLLRVCRKLTSPSFKILQSCIVGIHQPTSPSLTKVPHIFQLQPTTRILSSACPTNQSARIKNIFSQQVLFPPPGQAAGTARNEKPTTSS